MSKTSEEKAAAKAVKDQEKAAAKAAESTGETGEANTEQESQTTDVVTPVASKGDAVVEFMHQGKLTSRVYSEEAHGEDFMEKAEGFAKKKLDQGLKGKLSVK